MNGMKNAIWNAVPNIGMIVAGGNPITMAISLASQVGIGYMNYRREKAKIGLEQERKEWELQRSAMEQFNGLRRELFDTAWRLADRYKFPDSYRLTERQITQYNRILMDPDDQRRYDRLFYVKDSFAASPPFWYYLGSAANAVYQDADRYGTEIAERYKGYTKDAFDNLAKYVGQRITDMETMSEIAENEMELERFRVDNHLPSNDSSQVKALTVNHRRNTLKRILLDESFKNRQMMSQKSEECVSAIREIVETKRLINPEKKTNTYFYIKGDHHFDTYLRKNGKALMNAGCENLESIIAILNDRSIWDSDLIFTTYNVILFEKKKHKGSILYIEAEKHYTNDRLNFGGNSFLNGSVDLCVLREVTDALAVVHNNSRVQANENLSELIRSVKNRIINSAHYNEYAMPPKTYKVDRVEVEHSLLKVLSKGLPNNG